MALNSYANLLNNAFEAANMNKGTAEGEKNK